MTAETSHKWASMFLDSDHTEFIRDSRGGKHSDSFYDTYPEIEADAKAFVADKCSQKSGEFKAIDLARFINKQYCDLNDIDEQASGGYIRSERSSQLDLIESTFSSISLRKRDKEEKYFQPMVFENHHLLLKFYLEKIQNDSLKRSNQS
ncbi:unnamed protein product [Adineta ricciae]|uniref:Uncharacterized protein n=1 Tax=Adineta ricciae TaxID=249248 RepID=A0A815UUM3_ADIRI|nr:unnamed protein product [Adineta ricciae]